MRIAGIIMVIIIAANAENIVNKYEIVGEATYFDVLSVVTEKSQRSVLGEKEKLREKRDWNIRKKDFGTVIDQIRKNLDVDGYDLLVNDNEVIVRKRGEKKPEEYEVYMPNKRRYLLTNNKQEYKNALLLDEDYGSADSIKKWIEKEGKKRYRIELHVIGYEAKKQSGYELMIESPIEIGVEIGENFKRPRFSTGLNIEKRDERDRYDFNRKMIFYVSGDTNYVTLNFGSETRRVNGRIESQQVVTESYESVFDGLTVRYYPRERFYNLKYRVGASEINLTGVPGRVITGSARIATEAKYRAFYIFPGKNNGYVDYQIEAILSLDLVSEE